MDAGKAPHDVPFLLRDAGRVRLSLEQDLNAANDREGHCTGRDLSLRAAGYGHFKAGLKESWAIAQWAAGPLSSSVLAEWWVDVVGGSSFWWNPSVACPGSTSAWRASSFSWRRDPCCGPGWAFRTGSSVWQHRQVAISGGQPTSGRSNPVPRFRLDPFQDGAIYSNFPSVGTRWRSSSGRTDAVRGAAS